MKGFIEVTIPDSEYWNGCNGVIKTEEYKKAININHIVDFKDKVVYISRGKEIDIVEYYEEIKKLIEDAQK